MKTLSLTLLVFTFLVAPHFANAQDKDDIKKLIDQGTVLSDSGKYNTAIDKYNEALLLDHGNLRAQYELSYTLTIAGRPKEAIPYLEKVTVSNKYPEAYDLLASIYDDSKDYEKAIACYKQGLIAFPRYQRLHFNLSISYLRQKKYPESEAEAIEAIKLDPKHSSSQRTYAMATFGENKRGPALLAWCSFLMLEPQSKRSADAYSNIKQLLNYGVTRTDAKKININISANDLSAGNLMMPIAVLGATDGKKDLSPVDSLTLQLTAIFKISGELEAKKQQSFFSNFYAKFFNDLASSDNMPAFTRLISLSAYRDDNLKWFKDNGKQLSALSDWVKNEKREF